MEGGFPKAFNTEASETRHPSAPAVIDTARRTAQRYFVPGVPWRSADVSRRLRFPLDGRLNVSRRNPSAAARGEGLHPVGYYLFFGKTINNALMRTCGHLWLAPALVLLPCCVCVSRLQNEERCSSIEM